jgi:hypothetical protein
MLFMLCGDVTLNQGPIKVPRGLCGNDHRAVLCEQFENRFKYPSLEYIVLEPSRLIK